jgi:exopolysaccharide biosynthesis polyprenyl glycosylphosphotransferase
MRSLPGVDAVAGTVGAVLGVLVAPDPYVSGRTSWLILFAIGCIGWPVSLASTQGYQRRRVGVSISDEIVPVLRASALVIVAFALPTAWFGVHGLFRSIAFGVPFAASVSIGARIVSTHQLQRARRSGNKLRRVILVGSPEAVLELRDEMQRGGGAGMSLAGVCVPASEQYRAEQMGLSVVGDIDEVAHVADWLDCHAVAVTGADASRQSFIRQLAWSLEGVRADLLVHPGLGEIARTRMHIQAYPNLPLLHVAQPHFSGWRKTVKRVTDLLFAALSVVLVSPLLAAISLTIRLSDPHSPVLFRQRRVGIDGKPFTMYKFRTMVPDAETRREQMAADNEGAGPLFKMQQDPRVTRAGKFLRQYSLDELPQLFNVLGGSMSLVGPRPALQSEVDTYAEHIRRRLKVTPGLTGLWQISGRSTLSWQESVRLDLRYVENWSIWLDLVILMKTGHAVLAKKGGF